MASLHASLDIPENRKQKFIRNLYKYILTPTQKVAEGDKF